MSSALWIGTSGLNAATQQIDVIGNNLANSNTVGFKSGDASFASMLSQSLSGAGQVGQGVVVNSISTQFSQGSFQTSSNVLDVAIDGQGFFVVKDEAENLLYYTRAGSFSINKDGDLIDVSGYAVQGDEGSIVNLLDQNSQPQETSTIEIGINLNSEAESSTSSQLVASQVIYDAQGAQHTMNTVFQRTVNTANLWSTYATIDGGDAVIPDAAAWLEFNTDGSLVGTGASDTTRQIIAGDQVTYSPNGTATDITETVSLLSTFTNTAGATNSFAVDDSITYTGTITPAGTIATSSITGAMTVGAASTIGTLLADIEAKFGADDVEAAIVDGRIVLIDQTSGQATLSFTFTAAGKAIGIFGTVLTSKLLGQPGAATAEITDVTYNFSAQNDTWGDGGKILWDRTATETESTPSITSYAMDSKVGAISNDGYGPGTLISLKVGSEGTISGLFTNGQQQNVGTIQIAKFNNPGGLDKSGSYFLETTSSGQAMQDDPGAGGLGTLRSNSLEISNTDVATEFIKMIAAQRAYSASAKIITTADQMMQELMAIKR